MSFFTFFELQIITITLTGCFSQDSIFWADHPYVIFKEQTTFMSYKRGNNVCYLVKKNYAITLINHTKNVKLIMLSSLPFPLFEDLLLFFFGVNHLWPLGPSSSSLLWFCRNTILIPPFGSFMFSRTDWKPFLLSCWCRQKKKRDGLCCCCITLPDNYRESSLAKKDFLKTIMDKIGAAMLSLPGKVFVIVITGALFGFNLYGAIMLKLSFDQNRFLPPDSMSYKYKFTNSKVTSQSWIKLSTHFLSLHFSPLCHIIWETSALPSIPTYFLPSINYRI